MGWLENGSVGFEPEHGYEVRAHYLKELSLPLIFFAFISFTL